MILHEMQDAGVSLRSVAWWTVFLPPASLVFCVLASLIYDYEEAVSTHCEVSELLPSISSVIGSFDILRSLVYILQLLTTT